LRLEEFIPCSVLQQTQMRESKWMRKVAIALARFHQQNVPEINQ
jgi:hypothetical protein